MLFFPAGIHLSPPYRHDASFDLNLFDALLLGLIAVFTVRGALRGFLAEMAGLVGIVAGVWLAGRYYPAAGKLIHEWTASSWSNTIAYVVVLCGCLSR